VGAGAGGGGWGCEGFRGCGRAGEDDGAEGAAAGISTLASGVASAAGVTAGADCAWAGSPGRESVAGCSLLQAAHATSAAASSPWVTRKPADTVIRF